MADLELIDPAEIWKDIPGFEGRYRVSNLGRVQSLEKTAPCGRHKDRRRTYPQAVLSPGILKGYEQVTLRLNNRSYQRKVHSLVLEAFVGPRPRGMQSLHKDGNSRNNSSENLRWGTPQENADDTIRHGNSLKGEKHHKAKLSAEMVLNLRARCRAGESRNVLFKESGLRSRSSFSAMIKGDTWSHL